MPILTLHIFSHIFHLDTDTDNILQLSFMKGFICIIYFYKLMSGK